MASFAERLYNSVFGTPAVPQPVVQPGISAPTQRAMATNPDLDAGLAPAGAVPAAPVAVPAAPVVPAVPTSQGVTQRPLNAQEALQRGDPKLEALLRKQQAGFGAGAKK